MYCLDLGWFELVDVEKGVQGGTVVMGEQPDCMFNWQVEQV